MDGKPGNKFPPISKMSDEDLRRYGMDNLIHLLRDVDAERVAGLREQSNLMKNVNQRMQTHLMEVRSLKEVNKRLQDENQEVRDLACFLDDDRQKGRKLAREWQRFGRYTSGVMKSELSAYQQKLKELEEQQEALMKENVELKELCIYLDEELKRYHRGDSIDRDDGDGSSSSSPTGDKISDEAQAAAYGALQYNRPSSALNEQTLQYIRQLEHQVQQMEQQRQAVSADAVSGRPESVMQAMRVLEIHEQLENPQRMDEEMEATLLDDAEKAIVRQMCNVVWKKLGDA